MFFRLENKKIEICSKKCSKYYLYMNIKISYHIG